MNLNAMDHGYAEQHRTVFWPGAARIPRRAAIGTSRLIEENAKQVNDIWLATVAKEVDTLSTAQAATLLAIADQCPEVSLPLFLEASREGLLARRGMQTERSHSYVRLCITKYGRKRPLRSPKDNGRETSTLGGNAVYAARALYRQVNDTLAWDDQLLCLPHGILVKRLVATEENGVAVVPNPARDQAALILGQSLGQVGLLMLYDLAGKEVMRVDIPEGEPRTEFATGALASGLYQYRVESDGTLIGHGKLAITR